MATKSTETKTAMSMEDMKAEMAKMLADAKAAKEEAEKLLREAKEGITKSTGMTAEELAEHKAYMNEYVEVKLFKDTGKYRDDVFVSVNGETCAIKRGERVKVKRKFALALDDSDKQDYDTAEMIAKTSGKMVHYNPND